MDENVTTANPVARAIALAPSLSADLAGELLREVSFVEERGACLCFDLVSGFAPVEPALLSLEVRTVLLGCFAKDPDQVREVTAAVHPSGLLVAWHWDGDGTLIFQSGDWLLCNSDCKKSYGWTRDELDWVREVIDSPTYYE